MEQRAAEWRYGHLHEKRPFHDGTFTSWAEKRSVEHPYHYNDGVTWYVTAADLHPFDQSLDEEEAPYPPPAGPPDQPE